MTYAIYEEFISEVEKKLKRVEKKCKKYGNPFTYRIIGEEVREIKVDGKKSYYNFKIIEVEGTAKINDYEMVAVLEIHDSGNIIRRINTEINIPERFKTTENICEHCNSKRFRNELYIIHNVITDDWKQVGSSCLKLYTGGLNAEYIASYIDGITKLEEYDSYVGVHGRPMYPIKDILCYATEIIDKIGYYNSDNDVPTKSLVASMMFGSNEERNLKDVNDILKRFNVSFEMKDFHKENTNERVEKIIEYYKSIEDDTEFMHNIHVMLNEGYINSKCFGYISYLPEGYRKYLQREAERQRTKQEEISEHFGNIGQRFKNVPIKYIKTLSGFETVYGYKYLVKFVIEDGHVFYWFGDGYNEDKEIMSVSFTIKEHGEYNGEQQTKVSRCIFKYK